MNNMLIVWAISVFWTYPIDGNIIYITSWFHWVAGSHSNHFYTKTAFYTVQSSSCVFFVSVIRHCDYEQICAFVSRTDIRCALVEVKRESMHNNCTWNDEDAYDSKV